MPICCRLPIPHSHITMETLQYEQNTQGVCMCLQGSNVYGGQYSQIFCRTNSGILASAPFIASLYHCHVVCSRQAVFTRKSDMLTSEVEESARGGHQLKWPEASESNNGPAFHSSHTFAVSSKRNDSPRAIQMLHADGQDSRLAERLAQSCRNRHSVCHRKNVNCIKKHMQVTKLK